MRRTVFAAAFGLTLLLGTPGHTQTAEAEALGVQVARTIFQAISFDKLIAKELGGASDAFADIKSRPEWSGYLIQAMQEEVRHDLPKFETMFGRALAKDMTVDELRAGATLLADPVLQGMIKSAAEGRTQARGAAVPRDPAAGDDGRGPLLPGQADQDRGTAGAVAGRVRRGAGPWRVPPVRRQGRGWRGRAASGSASGREVGALPL